MTYGRALAVGTIIASLGLIGASSSLAHGDPASRA